MQLKLIPEIEFPNGNFQIDINIDTSPEPLLDLGKNLKGNFQIEPAYFNQGINNAINACYARKSIVQKLQNVIDNLPNNYGIKIFDAWRPIEVQNSLYEKYFQNLKQENPNLNDEEIHSMTKNFVSQPSLDPLNPSVHNTGGAIDLTLIDASGKELDMGSYFDDFTNKSHSSYYENLKNPTEKEQTIIQNRRLLYHSMLNAGFTNLPTEWWHYDFGDKFWAIYTKKPMLYKGILKPKF